MAAYAVLPSNHAELNGSWLHELIASLEQSWDAVSRVALPRGCERRFLGAVSRSSEPVQWLSDAPESPSIHVDVVLHGSVSREYRDIAVTEFPGARSSYAVGLGWPGTSAAPRGCGVAG